MQRTKTYFLLLVFLFLLVLSASSTLAEEKTIRILHFNDFHGFAEPYKPYGSDKELGGISFLATKIHRLRSHK
ncbi:MAG: hypothetical protein WCO89_12070, partial [Syntrophus sp. (in: bacteria)]